MKPKATNISYFILGGFIIVMILLIFYIMGDMKKLEEKTSPSLDSTNDNKQQITANENISDVPTEQENTETETSIQDKNPIQVEKTSETVKAKGRGQSDDRMFEKGTDIEEKSSSGKNKSSSE